jgi:hypothetical protein
MPAVGPGATVGDLAEGGIPAHPLVVRSYDQRFHGDARAGTRKTGAGTDCRRSRYHAIVETDAPSHARPCPWSSPAAAIAVKAGTAVLDQPETRSGEARGPSALVLHGGTREISARGYRWRFGAGQEQPLRPRWRDALG